MPRSTTPGAPLLLFARNFLRHPRMLGSVIPSSHFLIDSLLAPVDWERARVLVEYGPGVGGITAEVLRRMHPEARLVAIETNPDFVHYLRRSIPDPRLTILHDSAVHAQALLARLGHARADYVISGVPFSTMPAELRESILTATHEILAPEGRFLVYQFSSRVLADLRRTFGRVARRFQPFNVLPAQLFFCEPNETRTPLAARAIADDERLPPAA
ncbi:MAG: methyltransferase [Gammaproteobacteria bacterium]|nr:methyltransferase [Gammaproteobacteria bacterium]